MAGKGPLDAFYKDSLRFGNLKVRSSSSREEVLLSLVAEAGAHVTCDTTAAAVLQPLQPVPERPGGAGGHGLPRGRLAVQTPTARTHHTCRVRMRLQELPAQETSQPAIQHTGKHVCFKHVLCACADVHQAQPCHPCRQRAQQHMSRTSTTQRCVVQCTAVCSSQAENLQAWCRHSGKWVW